MLVAPLAGAWIEICYQEAIRGSHKLSLPSRERGLKFTRGCPRGCDFWSLPSRERGLKYYVRERNVRHRVVAPLAGAWIEMISLLQPESVIYVAPLAGAWIEIRELRN